MRDGEIHLGELGRMAVPATTIQRPSLDSFAWWVSQSSTLGGAGNARPLHSFSSITLKGVSRIPLESVLGRGDEQLRLLIR